MSKSTKLFKQAKCTIPGGVNSPVRSFKSVGGTPLFIKRGSGAYIVDEDDNTYIDYVGSWGPLILGHAHPEVIKAVQHTVANGLGFGAPTQLEIELAELVQQIMPSMDMLRMVNSGTEATMSAIRLARAYTKRNKIIKFNGCYHGHADSFLVNAGSAALTLGIPSSPGVPHALAELTLTADFNDLNQVKALFKQYSDDIAAIIVEPIAGNMGCILPQADFLPGLRALCDQYNSVLIFDEVMTGFRVDLKGAQHLYQVTPDLTTLGKIIGGGMPVGAFGGKKAIMELIAPLGPVYQAGTLSGNPVAMAAGIATLKQLIANDHFTQITHTTQQLIAGIQTLADTMQLPLQTTAIGGMFGLCFTDNANIKQLTDVSNSHIDRYNQFFHAMLQQGCYFAPSVYEAGFVSLAHGKEEIAKTLAATKQVFQDLR